MTAQPLQEEDPYDPVAILRDLPERERAEFLRQYHDAVNLAHVPFGYRKLLHAWSLVVAATSKPGYYEAQEQAANAHLHPELFTPIEEIVPDWAERVEAARQARR